MKKTLKITNIETGTIFEIPKPIFSYTFENNRFGSTMKLRINNCNYKEIIMFFDQDVFNYSYKLEINNIFIDNCTIESFILDSGTDSNNFYVDIEFKN